MGYDSSYYDNNENGKDAMGTKLMDLVTPIEIINDTTWQLTFKPVNITAAKILNHGTKFKMLKDPNESLFSYFNESGK